MLGVEPGDTTVGESEGEGAVEDVDAAATGTHNLVGLPETRHEERQLRGQVLRGADSGKDRKDCL